MRSTLNKLTMRDLASNMEKMFFGGAQWDFIGEIAGRTIIMFLVILLVLRLSGRRGVRQLTLFEVAIILGMGSAAGDPMFQEDIPLLYGILVLSVTILIYKSVTWLASKSAVVHRLLEGDAKVVVSEGLFDIRREKDHDFSKMEFFTELRNHSIEHLGQVRVALLEPDGTLSVLFYSNKDVKYGLPLFPQDYKEIDPSAQERPIACMHCGHVTQGGVIISKVCPRCKSHKWSLALNSTRVA